jgi:DNA-binding XRE family transcriptional regulator
MAPAGVWTIGHTRINVANVNTRTMLTIANNSSMSKTRNAAAVGTLVRQTRMAAGLSQTELGERISASRFWVAEIEKGKASAELGLALKALAALGLSVRIERRAAAERAASTSGRRAAPTQIDLASVVAGAMRKGVAPSAVIGWPTMRRRAASTRQPRKR